MRDLGGVLSSDRTFNSRHEQQSARTAPSTTAAGFVAYSGFEIAARANTRTSSVRFTTAVPVATTFRYVAVSRNGFSTIPSSLHSTPIGAQLIVLSAPPEIVVTMVSMITGDHRTSSTGGGTNGVGRPPGSGRASEPSAPVGSLRACAPLMKLSRTQ